MIFINIITENTSGAKFTPNHYFSLFLPPERSYHFYPVKIIPQKKFARKKGSIILLIFSIKR